MRFAWVSMLAAGATALAVLLVGLAFLPASTWESFVPIATVVGVVGVLAAGASIAWVGAGIARPLRHIVQAVEADQIGEEGLRQFTGNAPSEVSALLYALHHGHARLHRTLAELQQDRAQMATILQNMADGLLVLDADERIELSNPVAQRVLHAATLTNRPLVEVARDAEVVELARAASGPHPVVRMIELEGGTSGPGRWIQAAATRLPDGERTVVLLQDVTELRRAEIARRDFVANVSHDLRTPVAALKALVETLEAGAIDDPQAGPDFLRRMHVEVEGLANLVADLLELARAEAGRLDLELEACDPVELLEDAVDRARPYAERLGRNIRLQHELDEGATVEADARRIGQVLGNLLDNAVKFSPPGGRIDTGARACDGFVEFWVADTGAGLRPDQLVRVFERFYKTDQSRSGTGTGLGLAICKHLVQAHGGSIWAESPGEGRGAVFRFTLPRTSRHTVG